MAVNKAKLFSSQLNKLDKAINAIPARQYYMALALVVLLTIKLVYIPVKDTLLAQHEQLQQLSSNLKSPDIMREQTLQMQQTLAEKSELHNNWLNQFYQDSNSRVKVAVVDRLEASAEEKGLLYLRSRWHKTPTKQLEQYSTIEPLIYSVLVRGDYNKVRELLREWQALQPLVKLEEVVIKDRKDEGVVAANIKMSVYRLRKEGAL